MLKFFQPKMGPVVAFAGAYAALAATVELMLQSDERAYKEKGQVTHRVFKTTNGTNAYLAVEVVPDAAAPASRK